MKMIPILSMAVLLFGGVGCSSARSTANDEAKVVARILARTAPPLLTFQDRAAAQDLLSSLDASEHFTFGVILDAKKNVFASYSRPDQISEKDKFLARVAHSVPTNTSERITLGEGVAIAMVRIGIDQETIGYVAVARKAQ